MVDAPQTTQQSPGMAAQGAGNSLLECWQVQSIRDKNIKPPLGRICSLELQVGLRQQGFDLGLSFGGEGLFKRREAQGFEVSEVLEQRQTLLR
jgi:hypothetical protein